MTAWTTRVKKKTGSAHSQSPDFQSPIPRPQKSSPSTKISGKALRSFRSALLAWYDENRRDLPWRRTSDPYRIWLSEIMLQQTRVAAVLEHYRIFLERFPDVYTLAAAPLDAVLTAWSGLGYYRRARMMHECAKKIVGEYGGKFPASAETLQLLPGIGRYTAAAIASIAFAGPIAVVDGNVERVLHRLLGISADTALPKFWRHAQTLLDAMRPGDFNQAMMELGAVVCVPREPRCLICPVRKWCVSKGEVPRVKSAPCPTKKEIWCVIEQRDGRADGVGEIRLAQRPKNVSLMADMWELPQTARRPNNTAQPWRTFRHSITVTNYTVHVFRGDDQNGRQTSPFGSSTGNSQTEWIPLGQLPQLPLTGLTRKILKASSII